MFVRFEHSLQTSTRWRTIMVSMIRGFLVTYLLVTTGLWTVSEAQAQSADYLVTLKGPVEAVNSQQLTITILGQTLPVSSAVFSQISIGNFLALNESTDQTTRFLAKISLAYTPGGTKVFISGVVAEVNLSLAKFRIGAQWIDYTRILGTSNFTPAVGSSVAVLGTQPALKGIVLADSANTYNAGSAPPLTTVITQLEPFYGPETLRGYEGGIVGGGIILPTGLRRQSGR